MDTVNLGLLTHKCFEAVKYCQVEKVIPSKKVFCWWHRSLVTSFLANLNLTDTSSSTNETCRLTFPRGVNKARTFITYKIITVFEVLQFPSAQIMYDITFYRLFGNDFGSMVLRLSIYPRNRQNTAQIIPCPYLNSNFPWNILTFQYTFLSVDFNWCFYSLLAY